MGLLLDLSNPLGSAIDTVDPDVVVMAVALILTPGEDD